MIGTRGAAVLAIVNLLLAGILGLAVGGFLCLVRRRPWSLKLGLTDAMLAMFFALVTACVFAAMLIYRGVWASAVGPAFAVATASVVVRHFLVVEPRPSD